MESYPRDESTDVLFRVAVEWLLEHQADALLGPTRLIHGDPGLHNQILENGSIQALLDWEMVSVTAAAREVGYCRMAFRHLLPWDEFTATYVQAGGPAAACAERAVVYWWVFIAATAASLARMVRHLFRQGALSDITFGHAGYLIGHFADRELADALRHALAR